MRKSIVTPKAFHSEIDVLAKITLFYIRCNGIEDITSRHQSNLPGREIRKMFLTLGTPISIHIFRR